ncbi:MAG: glycosyltransferase family 4 protein [Deltaproteobacteria bacterium]|nr:glycosyltransferase family 4 protein [Deltaproteobacteria bacterium]
MKIAVLIRRFVLTGGAERYAVEVTRRLARENDVSVFAQEWSFEGKEKINFHRIPRFFIRPNFLNQLLFSFFTRRSLDDSFDIVHTHERVCQFDVLTVHCPCFRSIVTRHKSPLKRFFVWLSVALSPRKLAYLWLEKRQFAYNRKRLWIAVSENVKKNIQTNYPLPDECFGIVYPGVDSNLTTEKDIAENRKRLRSKLGIEKDDLVVLFVGTEFKRKGLDALLKGFALLPRSNMKLVIAGEGRPDRYMLTAKGLGIERDVIFLGLVENIEEAYAISDVYILPTLSDPAGMAPLEAMVCGVATVISCDKYAGIAECMRDQEAIILKDPNDPEEIAGSLRRLMVKDYRRELGNKGRILADRGFPQALFTAQGAFHESRLAG